MEFEEFQLSKQDELLWRAMESIMELLFEIRIATNLRSGEYLEAVKLFKELEEYFGVGEEV